jgi:hypothetical protein
LPRLPSVVIATRRLVDTSTIVPIIGLSIEILLAYTIVTIFVALAYFLFADVSRKLS